MNYESCLEMLNINTKLVKVRFVAVSVILMYCCNPQQGLISLFMAIGLESIYMDTRAVLLRGWNANV